MLSPPFERTETRISAVALLWFHFHRIHEKSSSNKIEANFLKSWYRKFLSGFLKTILTLSTIDDFVKVGVLQVVQTKWQNLFGIIDDEIVSDGKITLSYSKW